MVSRVQVVEHVLSDYGVMLAGLQEGRAKSKAVQNGVFYTIYCSPADEKGSYGSQVWIHNSVQFRPSCWKDLAPRIVYVDGTSRKWARKVRVVSAHAPHEKSPPAEKDVFWDNLRHMARELFASRTEELNFLCIDANARAGANPSQFFGSLQPERENDNGMRFKSFLESAELFAITTFFEAGPTWLSQNGGAF